MEQQVNTKKVPYCGNCGKYGHTFKKCHDPITSVGVIAFHIDTRDVDPADSLRVISRCCTEEHDLNQFFNGTEENYTKILHKNTSIKFLMIRRKNSLGYMEFVRGRYQTNNYASIENLFKQMVSEEMEFLLSKTFDEIWADLWLHKTRHNQYEFKTSKKKFEALKKGPEPFSLKYLARNVSFSCIISFKSLPS